MNPLFFGFLAMLFTLIGGLFALRFKDHLHLVLGFSGGVVIGISLFDLLVESLKLSQGYYDLHIVLLFVVIGYLIYLILDRTFSSFQQDMDEHECKNISHRGKMSATILCLHSVIDGFALGVAFHYSVILGVIFSIGILSHDMADGINVVTVIFREHGKNFSAFKVLLCDSIAPIIGIIISFFIVIPNSVFCLVLAIFTGFLLFIGSSIIHRENTHHHSVILTTFATVFGMGFIYLVVSLVG